MTTILLGALLSAVGILSLVGIYLSVGTLIALPFRPHDTLSGRKDSFIDIASGRVHKDFKDKRTNTITNGLKLKYDKKDNKIIASPRGTYASHAISRMISR